MIDPWWAVELDALRSKFEAFLARAGAHDPADITDAAAYELSRRLLDNRQSYPNEWFEETTPSPEGQSRFRALAWQVLKRPFYDALRATYRYDSYPSLDFSLPDPKPSPEELYSAMELLRILAREIASLTVEQRELLARASRPRAPQEPSLNASERMMLSRLRRELLKRIRRRHNRPR